MEKHPFAGGAGIFYDQVMVGPLIFSFVSTPPFFANTDLFRADQPKFPDAFFAQRDLLTARAQIEPIQFNLDQPTVFKYNLDVQRAVTPTTSLEAGFAATRAWHLMRVILANSNESETRDGRLFIPAGSPLIHPGFGRIRPKQSDSDSSYYALRMQLNQRLARGMQFRVAYTFSKALDTGSSFAGSNDWGNEPGGARYLGIKDKGLSAFDIRNVFSANFTYDLPGRNLTGPAGKVLRGWQGSGIVTIQGGVPFNVETGVDPSWWRFVEDYPDVVPGAEIRYNTQNPNRYFEPSAFTLPGQAVFPVPAGATNPGFVGNAARNLLTGPGIAAVNFVLAKNTLLSERVNLQFRAEFHNLFNRPNFESPSGDTLFDTGTGAVRSDVGVIEDTSTTARQIQFGLKVQF